MSQKYILNVSAQYLSFKAAYSYFKWFCGIAVHNISWLISHFKYHVSEEKKTSSFFQ